MLSYEYISKITLLHQAVAKAAFNKMRALFTSTLDLELRKKLVKCNWTTLRKGEDTHS